VARRFNPKRLQRARKTAGLNAGQVGQALGRSESLVWMVEGGHRIPPPELLADWCGLLGCSIDSVFTEDNDKASV
jgi:transcriptional regulator with XRE-family HTH domain